MSHEETGKGSTSERFAVEADRRVVGVAVRGARGFRFFSSDPDYAGLEAQTFPRVRALMHKIGTIARALAEKRRGSGKFRRLGKRG